MLRQRIIVLRGQRTHFGQVEARHPGEVVVLVVVADIVRQEIERTIVGIRLLPVHKFIVLGNEMTRNRMQAQTKPIGQQEVPQRGGPCTHNPTEV